VRRRFKIGFVILLVATILWMVVWWQHILAYDEMARKSQELYWKRRRESPWLWYVEAGLYPSIFEWGNGLYLAVSGLFIFVAWELVLEWAYKDWRKEKMVKDEKVGWVAKTLKTIASLLVIVLYPIALFAPVIIFLV
jgi:high-affinity Fe2+/Pb2+ permease